MDISVWTYAAGANRWALYTTMLVAAGSGMFLLAMRPVEDIAAATTHVGRIAAVASMVLLVFAIGLGGADMVSGGVEILASPETWAMGFDSTLGCSALIGLTGLTVLLAGMASANRWALGGGASLVVGSFLVTGHAATAAPVLLMSGMVAIHLGCGAFWLGALYPLYVTTQYQSPAVAGSVMTQFSRMAIMAVTLLAASGMVISWVQVRHPAALINTVYGWRLLLKVVLFAIIVGLAAYNKVVLTPRLTSNSSDAAIRLRRIIRAEYLMYLLILAAAASLSVTEPPRALH